MGKSFIGGLPFLRFYGFYDICNVFVAVLACEYGKVSQGITKIDFDSYSCRLCGLSLKLIGDNFQDKLLHKTSYPSLILI